MTVVASVLRVLSDFGDGAGWLIATLVLFVHGRRIIETLDRKIDTVAQENEKAHAAITENVQENRRRIDAVAQDLAARIDTVAQDLGAIARDVSFLAGRQSERDRTTGPQDDRGSRARPGVTG